MNDPLGYYRALDIGPHTAAGPGHPWRHYSTFTQDDIKAMHRARVKETHPDAGGDPEEFRRVQEAYEVLGNEEARAHYDKTGERKDSRVDEELTQALNLLGQVFENFFTNVENIENAIFRNDPIAMARMHINGEIAKIQELIEKNRHSIVRLESAAKRFTVPEGAQNYLVSMIEYRIGGKRRGIEDGEKQIALAKRALALIDGAAFRADSESDLVRVTLMRVPMGTGTLFTSATS